MGVENIQRHEGRESLSEVLPPVTHLCAKNVSRGTSSKGSVSKSLRKTGWVFTSPSSSSLWRRRHGLAQLEFHSSALRGLVKCAILFYILSDLDQLIYTISASSRSGKCSFWRPAPGYSHITLDCTEKHIFVDAQFSDLLSSFSHVGQQSKSLGEHQDLTDSTKSCRLHGEDTVVQIPTGLPQPLVSLERGVQSNVCLYTAVKLLCKKRLYLHVGTTENLTIIQS